MRIAPASITASASIGRRSCNPPGLASGRSAAPEARSQKPHPSLARASQDPSPEALTRIAFPH
ncbi:hypothetical protein WOLCODRAFT_29440 [Wolfiporia cocos MD-104 SS10]|uniref:Uncharacterized protein n=1 Tax=Wolfiporia cocos (strain MD-104) TaxID=742152 RepID=A0A2H3JHC8_WOLCO|nr:hypothetical protein WOLCODRAFT_29440 [Wolfiporia cocos MD-104 SS10]